MARIQQELTDPEHQVRQAAKTGRLVDLRTGTPEHDDPAHGASWNAARTVRADLLVELLTASSGGGRVQAVKLRGARITGPLDLEAATLACPLLLHDCFLEEAINLQEAEAQAVRLPGCYLPGLSAARLNAVGLGRWRSGSVRRPEVITLGCHEPARPSHRSRPACRTGSRSGC